jgi:hypothetical protein
MHHVGIGWKLLASQVFLKGSKELSVTGPNTTSHTCD